MEAGPIERFMENDHVNLDRLLSAACSDHANEVDEVTYTRFRHDLLRHIGMEEKILLPWARSRRGGEALPMASQLRRDHGEIAKLLVRSPTRAGIDELRVLLGAHNAIEEGPQGLYAMCDALGPDNELLDRLKAAPRVPLAPYYDGPSHHRDSRK